MFDPQGNLIYSSGDNTNPFGSDGYAPADEQKDREPWDAQRTSANTANLVGKILRIRPTPEGGYTIPDGNLFPKDGSKGRPEIYVMGCRNPWRINIDSKTGWLYWGEVGPDARKDGPRGPRGYDEINQARKAGFFGWPYFVGNNFAYSKYDFATKEIGASQDPVRPVNTSVNNTGAKELPPAQPAWIYWPYEDSPEFPMLGTGGRTACAGPVFHYKASFEKTNGFPAEYDGSLLFWDWQRPFMKWARMKTNGDLAGIEAFSNALAVVSDKVKDSDVTEGFIVRRPVDARFGPDGCLYMLDYGTTWGANPDAKLLKISYVRGNLPPVVELQQSATSGREPLSVKFTSDGTRKREGGALTYAWRMKSDGPVVSTEPSFSTTFEKNGNATVELTVTDAMGASTKKTATVVVGNSVPEVRFEQPVSGDFFTPGKPIAYKVSVMDKEDGDSIAQPDAMGVRVVVDARWLKSADEKNNVDPGLALAKQSDCFNCHQVEQRLVGPSYLEVAERYRGVAGALEASVLRVRNGSSGVWGPIPMLAHQQHTSDEIAQMVAWVFSLERGKTNGSGGQRGLTGSTGVPSDAGLRIGILEASYTDNGRGAAAALTGKTRIELRSRRIEAESTDTIVGCKSLGSSGASGKKCLGGIADKNHAVLKNIPLNQTSGFTCRVSSGGVGGKIEIRVGSPEGPIIGSIDVQPTGGWDNWVELKSPISKFENAPDRADIFVVFSNPGKSGLMNFDWIQFEAP
jgi:cytochrome c